MSKPIAMIIAVALVAFGPGAYAAKKDKATVCHEGSAKSVSASAVPAHLAHGDTKGACDGDVAPPVDPDRPEREYTPLVVMMRCETIPGGGVQVIAVNTSVIEATPLTDAINPGDDCPTALAGLLKVRLQLRSVNGGSADYEGSLRLYTDYLLLGRTVETPDGMMAPES
jgi:hypothetical protein